MYKVFIYFTYLLATSIPFQSCVILVLKSNILYKLI